jgi:hypothetical protein
MCWALGNSEACGFFVAATVLDCLNPELLAPNRPPTDAKRDCAGAVESGSRR